MKYRKRPIVIEAFQMTADWYWRPKEWPAWLRWAWGKGPGEEGELYRSHNNALRVRTLEGYMVVEYDDYIIQGIEGELYPCKPGIFEATYEEVQ